jgi:hypothetical protein
VDFNALKILSPTLTHTTKIQYADVMGKEASEKIIFHTSWLQEDEGLIYLYVVKILTVITSSKNFRIENAYYFLIDTLCNTNICCKNPD